MIDKSYETYDKWQGRADKLVEQDGDFKNVAQYVIAAIIARELKEQFSFNDAQEKRFVESSKRPVMQGSPISMGSSGKRRTKPSTTHTTTSM